MKILEKQILETLSYFHIFKYPLSRVEIFNFLFYRENSNIKYINSEINTAIDNLISHNIIGEKNGFYFLIKRADADIIQTRIRRGRISENKYQKALKIINILKHVPCIKMIAVCNCLSYNNSEKNTDIDLFITVVHHRIWLVRLITAGILKFLKRRPTKTDKTDKICPSFFISEEKLNLENIQYNFHVGKFDIYLIYWIATLIPVYSVSGAYEKFIADNLWIKKYLKNWHPYKLNAERKITEAMPPARLITFLLSFLIPENLAKKIQLRIMPLKLTEQSKQGVSVIISDYMLKFHDKDRREEFYNKWKNISVNYASPKN